MPVPVVSNRVEKIAGIPRKLDEPKGRDTRESLATQAVGRKAFEGFGVENRALRSVEGFGNCKFEAGEVSQKTARLQFRLPPEKGRNVIPQSVQRVPLGGVGERIGHDEFLEPVSEKMFESRIVVRQSVAHAQRVHFLVDRDSLLRAQSTRGQEDGFEFRGIEPARGRLGSEGFAGRARMHDHRLHPLLKGGEAHY